MDISADQTAQWAAWFALLGCPTRLCLVRKIVHAGPISVNELAHDNGLLPSTVSHSLRLLRAHGIVVGKRHGREMRYLLASEAVRDLIRHIDRSAG